MIASQTTKTNSLIQVPIEEWTSSQEYIDEVSLALHQLIAEKLRANNDLINVARNNLKSWMQHGKDIEGVGAWAEWKEILDKFSIDEVIEIITANTDEGQRLRSSSPFVGIVSQKERERIMVRCAEII